jgi:hypothetical protein
MDLNTTVLWGVDWINLVRCKGKRHAFVYTVMNIRAA